MEELKKLKKRVDKKPETVDDIISYCERKNYRYHETCGGVFINTGAIAGWFILCERGCAVKLFHENYRKVYRNGPGVQSRYHEHPDIWEKDLSIMDYITYHDRAMKKSNRKPHNVVDKFEQQKKEKKNVV